MKVLLIWLLISFFFTLVVWPALLGPRQDDD